MEEKAYKDLGCRVVPCLFPNDDQMCFVCDEVSNLTDNYTIDWEE